MSERYRSVMHRLSSRAAIAAISFGVLTLGGVIMFIATAPTATASFGWFAYQPLAAETYFSGALVVLTPLMATAAAISIVGIVGLSLVAGYGIGQRRSGAR